jgi:hypothetical protein
MASNGTLSPKQEKALAFLMASPTIAEAASKAGVGERTVVRWLNEDEAFKAAYLAARRQAMSQTIAMLQQSTKYAVSALRQVMADSKLPASARVSASKAILELAMRGLEEEDLERRIAALESSRPHTNGRMP